MKRPRWVCFEALIALALLLAFQVARASDGVVRVDHAEFIADNRAEPPPDAATWQPVALSHRRFGAAGGDGWYRTDFSLPRQPEQPFAVYTPYLRVVGAVYVNGTLVGRTDPPGALPMARRPQLFVVPPSMLRVGANRLQVHATAVDNFSTGLAPLSIGPETLVRPVYERRAFWQVTAVSFSSLIAAIFATISLLLWLRRRQDRLYAWFGLSALSWAVYVLWYVVRFPPLPPAWWTGLCFVAAHTKLLFMALFALEYVGWRPRALERGLWVWGAVSLGVILATDVYGHSSAAVDLWRQWAWAVLAVFYPCVLAFGAWRRPTAQNILLALTNAVHPVINLYADLVALPPDVLNPLPYDFTPMQFVVVWILIRRFAAALDQAEQLNTALEQRVADKHAELEQQYARTRELEREQTVVQERARIMGDMHDGIGGQLISTLSLVEHGQASKEEIAGALRECIDDLRLAIDSLEPTDDDLLPVLGNLRYRLEPRLKAGGVALDWRVRELPQLRGLTPQNVLHILRILQEAFTNVLKHAQADRVAVETGVEPDARRVYIRVSDNGRGFDGPRREGHGLANMLRRARAVGGELLVRPSSGRGTTLELLLPVG
jgi:signal transduction histidine kinase